jgi:hypothetical protein
VFRLVLTGIPMPAVKRILIVGLTDNYLVRQEFEDKMEELLAKSGVTGNESHMVFSAKMTAHPRKYAGCSARRASQGSPPGITRSGNRRVLRASARLYTFWPYWNLAYTSVYSTTSYIKQNTVIPAECNIYNVKDEKLIWSGESDTMLEKSFEKMGKGYAQSLYNQLKRDKGISKK